MRGLLRYFNRNLLLKVAGYNSLHILVRIGTGGIMSWVLAHLLGTAGMAVMGNFRNFYQGLQSFSMLGMENGLVRYAAQFKEDTNQLKPVFSTAWIATLIVSVVLSLLVFFGASPLDAYLIGFETSYAYIFKALAVTLPFYVIFTMITSLLQGFEWYKSFVVVNILVSLVVFGCSVSLIYFYLLDGALIAIVATPIIQCFIAALIWCNLKKETSLRSLLFNGFSALHLKPLMSYSGMALLSALLIPVTYIAVRQDLREVVGDTAAGNWEGLQRISGYYMLFVTSLISLYVLPQLSKDPSHKAFRKTSIHFYKTILLPVSLGLLAIYVSRDLLVQYLFTQEFIGMLPMYKWQLAGDFIKIITTVLAFRFIAINDLKKYAIAEVASLSSFYVTSYVLIRSHGSEGVVMAHLASHLIYLLVILILLRKELFKI